MARLVGAMVTEEDIKWMIDNNKIRVKIAKHNYTKKCATKDEVESMAYVKESFLTGMGANQLVKWDLIKPEFYTTLFNPTSWARNTVNEQHSIFTGEFGWTVTHPTWIIIDPSYDDSPNHSVYNVFVSANNGSSTRTGIVTFTDTETLEVINISVSQAGNPLIPRTYKELWYTDRESRKCLDMDTENVWMNHHVFSNASEIYKFNNPSLVKADAGWYRDGTYWAYWDGNSFTSFGYC